ncbi:MAG: FeoA family protein [Caulobacteraceae bacterium]|nr:FeoA family protein [Caulobacteraceae bacterium]
MTLETQAVPSPLALIRLSDARKGVSGRVVKVGAEDDGYGAIEPDELERRLLEMGFVEGARIKLLYEGFIGRDPIAVRLDDMRVALRRREARGVWLDVTTEPAL